MGVDVDETRCDYRPVGINLAATAAIHPADLRDPTVGHGHVGGAARGARPVHHDAAPNDQIVLGHGYVLSCPQIRGERPPCTLAATFGLAHEPDFAAGR